MALYDMTRHMTSHYSQPIVIIIIVIIVTIVVIQIVIINMLI